MKENLQLVVGKVKYYGYKGKDFYIFFSENEISVYPIEKSDNSTAFSDLLAIFNRKLDVKSFVNSVTDLWPDYDEYYYDSNFVSLLYSTRGIKIQFNLGRDNGVTVYQNYNGYIADGVSVSDISRDSSKIPDNTYMALDKNSVNEYEYNRKASYTAFYSNANRDNAGEKISNKFVVNYECPKDKITKAKFSEINRQCPNSEININSDKIWCYDDSNFIYSIANKGIYMYNAETRETTAIKEGNEEFLITDVSENKIKYDESEISLVGETDNISVNLDAMWHYKDSKYIYSVTNQGIYLYNDETKETKALKEGNLTFELRGIYGNQLFYDDTLLIIKE